MTSAFIPSGSPLQTIKHTASVDNSRLFVATEVTTKSSTSNDDNDDTVIIKPQQITADKLPPPPFKKVMAANRAEISVRIQRAVTELNMGSVAIYVDEDRYGQHRWGADESYLLAKEESATPISAYLDIDQIINIAKQSNVDAIHPGYGFLSESPQFAQACADAGITFVGPTVENLNTFSDKTSARNAAIAAGVPVVPGSDALKDADEVNAFVDEIGLPVIIKAAMGGGGKGMRVVRNREDLIPFFESASSEALAAFGCGDVFVERFVEKPRHIEVQIIGDGKGNVIHLWERDCSIQRRHQKVIEMAPAWSLPDELRAELHRYAVELTSKANYKNAGTVEFLVDSENRPYFIEVNPRIQVEHTVTEEVTGIDVVQTQIRIAGGATFDEIGLKQENIQPRGVAIQCRVTTENPERDFAPDTGIISLYRHSAGAGIRMDGVGYSGLAITPYFDSMIVKYTARGSTFAETVARMKRVLIECRIRGVKTNIPFLLNVLTNPEFESGVVTTAFIDENPELKKVSESAWDFANEEQADQRKVGANERLMRYLANLAVNGHPPELGADPTKIKKDHGDTTSILKLPEGAKSTGGMRKILLEQGPEGYAKAVREHKGLLLMDTTWRDAHQSLLATRMRTKELERCADYTNTALANAFSLEMWGGATFDVAMRFLHECPWERLESLREKVPDVPFQMLLRGANAVGYTNYPDNVVHKFCKQAHASGIDIFRVFDSLNYLDNLKLGVDAAGSAGGFVEGTMSYTGNVADPTKGKYNLEYYLKLAEELVDMGVHSLAVKDMAGLLTPAATTMLVGALREQHPDTPIHVHTHDTPGTGVASMIAAAQAGADIVDVATDAMSGLTSQPSMGALVSVLSGTDLDTGIDKSLIGPLNTYWENTRNMYLPFESGQLSGSSDVYEHEIPGGQYTNLLYQSRQLGLTDKWPEIKRKYAEANMVLGDIPKVTPSSKVVGDLAQFMVSQNLDQAQVLDQAETLAFPESVVKFLRG
jgi:pyruvate carboxylase